MIDDWLCEGYAFAAEAKPAEALAAWWKVWEALRSRLTAEMTNMEEAGEHLFSGMSQCLSNWSQDFRLEAINASLKNPQCGELGIRFIRELLAALPEEEERLEEARNEDELARIIYELREQAGSTQARLAHSLRSGKWLQTQANTREDGLAVSTLSFGTMTPAGYLLFLLSILNSTD